MAEDEHDVPTGERGSVPASFDFDDESISTLLDTFVATQTGPQRKRISRPPSPSDTGAQAAQRTVFQHAPRKEQLPLVGDDHAARGRRIELLRALAERAAGSARARLLTSAAELQELLGQTRASIDTYRQALAADARDVVALRAIRRHAVRERDWQAAVDALGTEAALEMSPGERISALKLLAHIALHRTEDAAIAEHAAREATELNKHDFTAHMLLAAVRMARGDLVGGGTAIAGAADAWSEPGAQAVLIQHAGALTEEGGDLEGARSLYSRAIELDPTSLTARLGLIRVAQELGDAESCVESLRAAADQVADPSLSQALRRSAATLLDSALGRPNDALAELRKNDVVSTWTRAEIATRVGDLAVAAAALGQTSPDQSPELRAVASARTTRWRAELGGADESAPYDLPQADELGLSDYIQASRRLAGKSAEGEELKLVLDAIDAPPRSAVADPARGDKAARLGDGAIFFQSLEREIDRADNRLGAVLALAEVANAIGISSRKDALARGKERGGREPILCRALALLQRDDPPAASIEWLEEGAATTGPQGAFALTIAARLLSRSGGEWQSAIKAALNKQLDYWPALWELEEGESKTEQRMEAAVALGASRSGRLHASIWATDDAERFALAEEALDRQAPDPLLLESLVHWAGAHSEAAGELHLLAARHDPSGLHLERAAVAFRDAGFPARAAKALREALSDDPDNQGLQTFCEEAELQASEFARVADAAMQRAKAATDEHEKLAALCIMATVDRLAKGDMQGARLSLQSIAESRPEHCPTARALEWDSLREQDGERIFSGAKRLLTCLAPEASARTARHRLMVETWSADADILASDVDRVLRGIEDDIDTDPGLSRRVLGMAYSRGEHETALRALAAIQNHLVSPLEREAIALECAHILEKMNAPERALAVLDEAHDHPLALEVEARLLQASERWEEAATVYRQAASHAKDGQRAASLWRAAGFIYEEKLFAPERAVEVYLEATKTDITYLDVYRRLMSLYRSQGRLSEAEALTQSRIQAGADTPTLVALLLEQAAQRRERGDVEGVVKTLQRCLELDPNHFAALTELVETHRDQGDWQGATEALIRIARLKRSVEEQVWAFSQLAEVYDDQLQDLPRAEAALRQVLKLAPAHDETLDHLSLVLTLQGKATEAAKVLEELIRRVGDDPRSTDYRIRLAAAIEADGQPKRAERYLEQLRSERPTDVDVILAIADQFDRQGAAPAAAMHLNRALVDLREAIDAQPENEASWTTLVRVLGRRHGRSPASCAASAAIAVGYPASLFAGAVTDRGEALGQPRLPLDAGVDRIVTPRGLPPTALRLFAMCEQAFDKVLPFDTTAWKLKRVAGKQRSLVEEAGLVAEGLGISEPRMRVTHASPVACMPITGEPPTLVVGHQLLELTTRPERVFLFARALKIASNHLAPVLRASSEELDAALLALLGTHEASRAMRPAPPHSQELRAKLVRAVPRRSRDEVESLVLEIRGDADFSSSHLPMAIAELGGRVALTMIGDVPSAVDALLKVAGQEPPTMDIPRWTAIRGTPEAWNLVRFAFSDAHFEARAQAGVDP